MTAAPDADRDIARHLPRLARVLAALVVLIPAAHALAQTRHATTTVPSAPVEPYRPTLLAYGASDRYWIARFETYQEGGKPRTRTVIRGQELPGGDWQEFGSLYARAAALAESQGDLAVLLDDNSWCRVGLGRLATGTQLPGTGPVLAWASSARDLYAIRNVEGGVEGVTTRPATDAADRRPATTQAATTLPQSSGPSIATRPSAAAPPPTTRPARPTLLLLQQGQWVAVAELPRAGGPVALAVVANKPILAVTPPGGGVQMYVLNDNRWQDFGRIPVPQRPGRFDLLAAGSIPALWTIDNDGAMKLYLKREGDDWTRAVPFSLPPGLPENAQRTLAFAGQDFRLVTFKDNALWERRYDTGGAPRSDLAQLPAPQGNRQDALFWAIRGFVIAGMVIVMLLTFYHRRSTPDEARDDR
jgi:hypothetical protein